MNRQEVNLYTIDFHRSDQLLSVKQIAQITALAAVVLMVFYGFKFWQLNNAKTEVTVLVSEYQQVEDRLKKINAVLPKSNRADIEKDIEILKSDITYWEGLERIMTGGNLGNSKGFSEQLEGLARHAVSGLSLTNIKLLNGGSYLELDGWVSRPDAVPAYLHEIRQEKSFVQVKFGVISIDRNAVENGRSKESKKRSNELKFSVGKLERTSS